MTNLEWIKKNRVDLLEDIIVEYLGEFLSKHENIPFKEEDILQNDIGKHIILEWIRQDDVFLKDILSRGLCLINEAPFECNSAVCDIQEHCCTLSMKKWLEAEYKPMYKKGDIVILKNRDVAVVTTEDSDDSVIVSYNIVCTERGEGGHVPFAKIERKVGNIYDK